MESKAIKRFSLKMGFVTLALMIGMTFGLPSYVFALTSYPNNIGSTLQLGTADYTIQTDDKGTTDTSDDVKYVDLPTATILEGTLTINAVAVNANAYEQTITPIETSTGSGVWESTLNVQDNIKNYTVTYTLNNGDDVLTTATVDVTIESETPSFEWVDNSEQIIPTQINRSTTSDAVTIVMPYPYIYEEGSEVALNSEIKDNGTVETSDDYKIPTNITGLTVSIAGPTGANFSAFGLNATSGYYEWTIPSSATDAPAGFYTVTYQYSAANSYSIKKEFTFEIVTDEIETSLLINGYSDNSGSASIPSLMSLYVETALPTPVVVNTKASNAEVEVFTEVTLICKPTDTATTITYNILNTPSLRDLKFTPTVAGKYTISYKVTDFFGNTQTFSGDVNGITASKTSASGSGYIVLAYDGTNETTLANMKTAAENDTLATAEYSIPSIVAKNSTWTIPALFGIDKKYGYSELSFERDVTYTVEGKTSTTTEVYSSTASGIYNVEPYEAIDFTFSNEGSYKFTFKVKDADGNTLLSQSYTIQVEEDYVDTTNPTVTLNGLSNIVYAGKTITFTVSAADYRTDDEDVVADSRLNLVVQYKYGSDNFTTLIAKDGTYTIEVPDGTTNDTILTIQATATDDYGTAREIGTDTISATTTPTVKTKTITIKNYASDGDAPIIGGFDITSDWYDDEYLTLQTFETGDTITLPSIKITDNNSNLFVSARVKCNGTTLSGGTFSAYSGNMKAITMGGEEFIANLAGTYVVTYEAKDVNGNTSYKVFTFEVNGPEIPIISLGKFNTTYEYGTSIDLTNLSVSVNTIEADYTDNLILMTGTYGTYSEEEIVALINTLVAHAQNTVDPTDYNADKENYGDILESIIVQISSSDYSADNENPDSIIAGQSGNVTLKYWSVSSTGEFNTTPQVVTFATEDTTAPVLVVNNNGPVSTFSEYDSSKTDVENRVQIPDCSATDLSGVQNPTITAKYNNATKNLTIVKYEQDSTEAAEGYYGYFVANDDGYVTVTYSVSDNASPANTTTQTYSIGIGDISAPQISIATLQASLADEYKLNDTLTLDLNLLTVTDAEEMNYEDVDVKVTLNGTNITDDNLSEDDDQMSFLLDKAGTYVITFNTTDSAGNVATQKTITITVAETTAEGVVSTTVWGTILIIAALVVLGVVIYFFVKPSKVKTTGRIAKKDDEKKDKKDDKIVV